MTILRVRYADRRHRVVTVVNKRKRHSYRRAPCEQCPWRQDQVGAFPAEAFRISAPTCYDAAMHTFACHMSGPKAPATCAGFLLSESATHNLLVRIAQAHKGLDLDEVTDGGLELFASYRAMAVANGVASDDPALERIRDRESERKWRRV